MVAAIVHDFDRRPDNDREMLRDRMSWLSTRDRCCSYWYLSLSEIRQRTAIYACDHIWETKESDPHEGNYTRCINKCQYC